MAVIFMVIRLDINWSSYFTNLWKRKIISMLSYKYKVWLVALAQVQAHIYPLYFQISSLKLHDLLVALCHIYQDKSFFSLIMLHSVLEPCMKIVMVFLSSKMIKLTEFVQSNSIFKKLLQMILIKSLEEIQLQPSFQLFQKIYKRCSQLNKMALTMEEI